MILPRDYFTQVFICSVYLAVYIFSVNLELAYYKNTQAGKPARIYRPHILELKPVQYILCSGTMIDEAMF